MNVYAEFCSCPLIFTAGIVICKPSEYVTDSTLASFIAKCARHNSTLYNSTHSRNIIENIRDHDVTC